MLVHLHIVAIYVVVVIRYNSDPILAGASSIDQSALKNIS